MKILWVGNAFFKNELIELGHQVHFFNFRTPTIWSWNDLVNQASFIPDVLVVTDKSQPPYIRRIENFPCLTVFLCVDSHIHTWYPRYAQAFDLCTVSLRDHLPWFHDHEAGCRLTPDRLLWLPPFAKMQDLPPAEPVEQTIDLLFVGNVHPDRTPKRKAFLEALRERVPGLEIHRGDYRQFFPKAKVILNVSEYGDLNYRVFEALGMGGCLLTPSVGHGLTDLFVPDQDLCVYASDDVEDATNETCRLLQNHDLRARLAFSGKAKIDAGHRASHRAQVFADFLESCCAGDLVTERLAKSKEIHAAYLRLIYLHWAEATPFEELRNGYLQLARYRNDFKE